MLHTIIIQFIYQVNGTIIRLAQLMRHQQKGIIIIIQYFIGYIFPVFLTNNGKVMNRRFVSLFLHHRFGIHKSPCAIGIIF